MTKKGFSLSTKIILGVCLGILVGLFFGEMTRPLKVIGEAFIALLQMAVLPYVMVSLVSGLGKLDMQEAKMLAGRGLLLLLGLWVITFIIIYVLTLALPVWETASFFSNKNLDKVEPLDLVSLYIPANPFFSMSNSLVPGVVLFSIALGLALIGIKGSAKDQLISLLDVLSRALTRISGFVIQLTPIGVFAITAEAAGTLSPDELGKLQAYFYLISIGSLIAAIWILPALIALVTPFSYREVMGVSKDALVTAFTTGNLFVMLPVISQGSKALFRQHLEKGSEPLQESQSLVDILVPVSFNFPNVGKLMMLSFIPFAAWYSGVEMNTPDHMASFASGVVAMFGSVNVAIPFLLDAQKIPSDMFEMFLLSTIVNQRFASLAATMHLIFLSLVGPWFIMGYAKVRMGKIVKYAAITCVLMIGAVALGRMYFSVILDTDQKSENIIKKMQMQPSKVHMTVQKRYESLDGKAPRSGDRLAHILQSGVLQVGYDPDSYPFSFFNDEGELIGMSVELARDLAEELGVAVHFIPVNDSADSGAWADQVNTGNVDLIAFSPSELNRLKYAYLSLPYLYGNMGFVVPDHRRREFASIKKMQQISDLVISIDSGRDDYWVSILKDIFPDAKVVQESKKAFFKADKGPHEILFVMAEIGSAWTFLYPKYTGVIPEPGILQVPISFALPKGNSEYMNFLNHWIILKKRDGTIDRLYEYWVEGKGASPHKRRWSIIRDVLGWVDE